MIHGLVLASASPARLHLLQRAGVAVSVVVSGVDESGVTGSSTAELTLTLARLKAEAVLADQPAGDIAVLGCDSLLDVDGRPFGKPASPADAVTAWQIMRGRTGTLTTGHHLIVRRDGVTRRLARAVGTEVTFASLTDDEIDAYVATGEPAHVAGAFTIDGYGAAYVSGLVGDPHNVVGLSLPALREMLAELGIVWHALWARPAAGAHEEPPAVAARPR